MQVYVSRPLFGIAFAKFVTDGRVRVCELILTRAICAQRCITVVFVPVVAFVAAFPVHCACFCVSLFGA